MIYFFGGGDIPDPECQWYGSGNIYFVHFLCLVSCKFIFTF